MAEQLKPAQLKPAQLKPAQLKPAQASLDPRECAKTALQTAIDRRG